MLMTRAAKFILILKLLFSSNNIIRALCTYVDFFKDINIFVSLNYIITLICYATNIYVFTCMHNIHIYACVCVPSVITISIIIAVPIFYIILQLTTDI